MLRTPREHLPSGWPLPNAEESGRYSPIWRRAFEIHETAHDFSAVGPRQGILATTDSDPGYCDCYERAYQEFKVVYDSLKGIFGVRCRCADPNYFYPQSMFENKRHIQLE